MPRLLHIQCASTALLITLFTPLAISATADGAVEAAPGTEGQALNLSQVVVTGSRVAHSSFDLSASINVLTGEQMQDGQPMINASESLARVPGIVASNTNRLSSDQLVSSRGFGARAGFGVRGIRIYADGVPLSMPDGQGQMGSFSLSSAERMEVLRGPFSALYGNSSGGVIQLFTRDGAGAPRATASTYAGSFGTQRVDMLAEGKSGALGYLLDTSRYQTDGDREHSAAKRDQLNAKLNWQPGDNTKVAVVLNSLDQPYAQDPQGLSRAQMEANPHQAASSSITQNTGGSKSQTQLGLNIEHRLNEQDAVQATGWTGIRSSYGILATPLNAAAVIKGSGGISVIDRNFSGLDLRWSHKAESFTGPLTTTLGLTYEAMKDVRTGFENNAGIQGVLRRDEDNVVTNAGQYVQTEWAIGERWLLSGGVRQSRVNFDNTDRYIRGSNPDDSGAVSYGDTSPVLGLLYHLTPSVNLYANAGKGFETPTFIELAYRPGGASGLNFSLTPSTSKNYEAGVKAVLSGSTQVNLAVFKVDTEKEIVVDSSALGRTVYANAGKTKRTGMELSVDSKLSRNLKTSLAYTLLDARFTEAYRSSVGTTINNGNQLPGTPRTSVYAELAWRQTGSGFSTALEARYSGQVYIDDVNSDAAAAYTVLNWRAGFEHRLGTIQLKEFLHIENLGDKAYVGGVLVNNATGAFAPAPGRNYLLGISAVMNF